MTKSMANVYLLNPPYLTGHPEIVGGPDRTPGLWFARRPRLGDGSVYTRGQWAASQAQPGQWVNEFSSGGGQAGGHVKTCRGPHCARGVTARGHSPRPGRGETARDPPCMAALLPAPLRVADLPAPGSQSWGTRASVAPGDAPRRGTRCHSSCLLITAQNDREPLPVVNASSVESLALAKRFSKQTVFKDQPSL